jgi:LAS superfamily LD-carboxypeptidase LdcB
MGADYMSAMSPFREDVEVAPAQAETSNATEASSSTPFVQAEAEPEALGQWVDPEWEVEDVFEVAGEEEDEVAHPILSLFPLPKSVLDALTGNLWPLAVQLATGAGYTDANQLTNIVFYFKHPEVIGRKIGPQERELAKDWVAIRDGIVKPALQALPGSAPSAPAAPPVGAVTSPPIPASRLEWPDATADELAFMRAVYERHFKNSNVPGNSFVWDLPKDTLARIDPGDDHEARKDAAQAAGRLLEAARTELGGAVKIGVVSGYRSASLQFIIWQGKGRKGGFPAYYRLALKKGLFGPGDFGPEAVAKMAKYLGGYIAFPGFSNHQDGLAIDFGEVGKRGWSTVGWGSPFHRWLGENATRRFGFHPLSTEPWHWTFRGMPGAPAAQEVGPGTVAPAGGGGAVRAGALAVERVPLLARHAGNPPDLILRWNDMPSAPGEIDVVVHLHGFWKPGLTLPANIVGVSGLDLAPIDEATGQGRTRPTLTVLPRAHDTGVRQKYRQPDGTYKNGPFNVYTFPALVTKDGLPDLVRFALDRFAAEVHGAPPRLGRLILTAHSGGGLALLQILRYHDPHQVHVFDALYWPANALATWARRRIGQDRAAVKDLDPAAAREHMSARGGALRVFYQGRYAGGTRPNSLALRRAISSELGAEVRDWYRVEASDYDHFQIPRQYGWRVLADASADVPKAHQEAVPGAPRREAEAFAESETPAWAYAMPEVGEGALEVAAAEEPETWEASQAQAPETWEAAAAEEPETWEASQAQAPETWEASEVLRYEDLAGADAALGEDHFDEVGFIAYDEATDEDAPG